MDLTIMIKENIIRKKPNLYLYILPHSYHPPGLINRIIYGNIHCIINLFSEKEDHKILTCNLYRSITKQGYNRQNVLILFDKSIVQYKKKSLTPVPPPPQQLYEQSKTQQLFFHVGYNTDNMNSFEYQHKFKENILKLQYRHHLSNINNKASSELKLDRIVVEYYCLPNLGNPLSYRKLNAHIFPLTYPLVIALMDMREIDRVRGLKTLFLVNYVHGERTIILSFVFFIT